MDVTLLIGAVAVVLLGCLIAYMNRPEPEPSVPISRASPVRPIPTAPIAPDPAYNDDLVEMLEEFKKLAEQAQEAEAEEVNPRKDDPCPECGQLYEMTDDYICPDCRAKVG